MQKVAVILMLSFILLLTGCAGENAANDASDSNSVITSESTPKSSDDDYIENHYVFQGESDNWTGEMIVDSSLQFYEKDGVLGCDSFEDSMLTVTYKGDVSDLSSVKHLKIDYDAPLSGGGIEETHSAENPLQQKTFSMDGISGGGVLIQKNDIITVTATIDGKTESFEMRNQG